MAFSTFIDPPEEAVDDVDDVLSVNEVKGEATGGQVWHAEKGGKEQEYNLVKHTKKIYNI